MINNNILIPVRTVAEWGGLHEWVYHSVLDLQAIGWNVIVAGQSGVFEKRILSTGAKFIEVDWSNWQESVDRVMASGPWSKIFSHGPLARNLALKMSALTAVPVYHMIHGAYLDQVDRWSPYVRNVLVASPSVQDFVVRVGKVEPWKVCVVPNGVPDQVFDMPLLPLAEKIGGGAGSIVTAARLSPDKVNQIRPTIETVSTFARLYPDIEWTLDVMGDGPLRAKFHNSFRDGLDSLKNVQIVFSGWVEPDEVPRRMNRSVAACVAGMGGVRALAAGTLTVGVGAQGLVGVQTGQNLRAGIWSNFGDHGCPRFEATDVATDIAQIVEHGDYDDTVSFARDSCRLHRNETMVRNSMYDALEIRL
ncbi:hypothetical protein RF641_01580 [Arthrobacter sp. LS16]|uniref:hypothetical protein n=1 Tax=Arthrobacter sp. 'calajunan' TaxID=1690248 RepID=UPI003C78BF6F